MQNNELENVIINAILDKKGKKIDIIDLNGIDGADISRFIICQGGSTSQVNAIAENIMEETRRQAGIKPYNYDGLRNCQWVVIDYGSIMVHVFLPETREFYNLEELWSDAPIREIPDEE